jgi:hypothetical protein
MGALLVRLVLLTLGLGLAETALASLLAGGSMAGWWLLAAGLLAVVGGSAGVIVPILEGRHPKEGSR